MNRVQLDEMLTGDDLRLFLQEKLILDATSKICELMEAQDVSRADLARSLNSSKGYVTQLLDGSRNMTLRTLSDVFQMLNKQVCIQTRDVNQNEKPVELHLAGELTWNRPRTAWPKGSDSVVVIDESEKSVA